MKKKDAPPLKSCINLICSAGAVALFLMFPGGLLAGDGQIPEKVDINIQATCPDIGGLTADKKKVPGFNHKQHAETYLKGKSAFAAQPYSDTFTCAACHTGAQSADELIGAGKCDRLGAAIQTAGGPNNYKKMMHGICLDCHKKMQKASETSGPTKCSGCHSK